MNNKNNVSNFGADLKKYVNTDEDMQQNVKVKLGNGITLCASVFSVNDLVKESDEKCM